MLEKQQSVNDQNTEAIQNAIVAALRELTPDEQAGAIGDRIAKSGAKKSLYYAVLAKAGLPGRNGNYLERLRQRFGRRQGQRVLCAY